MNNNSKDPNNYISLQEATKFCNYSQEYLSLRARKGKLKAVKFGRNWVTKKEWLEEYLRKVEEYNNKIVAKKVATPPENLPIETKISGIGSLQVRPVPKVFFAFVIALVLLVAGITFGKTSFQSVYETIDPYLIKISEAGDLAAIKIFEDTKNFYGQLFPLTTEFSQGFDIGVAKIAEDVRNLVSNINSQLSIIAAIGSPEALELTRDAFKEYSQWLARQTFGVGQKVVQGYTATNNFLEQKLGGLGVNLKISGSELTKNINQWFDSQSKEIVQNYIIANDFVEEKISNANKEITKGYWQANDFLKEKISDAGSRISITGQVIVKGIKEIPQFVTKPFKEKVVIEKAVPKITEKEIEELKEEIERLKEEPFVVKEIIKEVQVEKITKIEPIKEITKEITKIDEEELAKIKAQLSQFSLWETDIENLKSITQKLQAHPTSISVPTAPIYIASQGLQVGGHGSFSSLGVLGHGAITDLGVNSLGVGGSAALGADSSDILTVNATSYFQAPVTLGTLILEGGTYDTTLQAGTPTASVTYILPPTAGSSGQALLTDGSGNLSWGSAAGATTFLALTDTPSAYTGAGSKLVAVNSGATALEFTTPLVSDIVTLTGSQALTNKTYEGLTITTTTGTLTIPAAKTIQFADAFTTSGAFALTLTTTGDTNITLPTTGTLEVTGHTHTLSTGATDVTATATELNLLDLSGLSVGQVLRATGATSAAWGAIQDSDLPSALTGKTYNGLTLTAVADGFTIAGGTTPRTLTVTGSNIILTGGGNTLTLAGNLTTANSFTTSGNYALTLTTTGDTNITLPTTGTLEVTGHTHTLSTGATDVTATAAELNLLDLAGLTIGQVLRATGATSAAWGAIQDSDLPSALTGKTYNALTLTAAADGFTLAGGTVSRTLTVTASDITLKGGGNTLDLGGNLTTANSFTTSGNYALTLTTTGATNVTLPTTGTLITSYARAVTKTVCADDSLDKTNCDYVCDGTDDHVQIQAALDALPATGGEVRLLDGTYNVAATINLDTNQTLRGSGRNNILTTSTANLIFLSAVGGAGNELRGIVITDLQIDGGAGSISDLGINFQYVDYSFIQNVYSRRHASGTGIYGSGIRLSNSDFNTVTDNIARENYNYGILVSESIHNRIIGNTCQGNGRGIFITTNSFYNIVSGNTCQGNTRFGIALANADNNSIIGNTCQANGRYCLDIVSSDHNTFLDNTCIANSQSATNTYDNIFLDSSSYNIIQGNFCRAGALANVPRYGININNAACNSNLVINNDLYNDGFGTGSFNDSGTGTVKYGNRTGAGSTEEYLFNIKGASANSALTVTQTNTGNIVNLVGDSITTGTGLSMSLDALSSGSGLVIDSTSTAFAGKLLNLTASGAADTTRYGVYSALSGAGGGSSTNIAGYFSAQNATNNYGLIVEHGKVGIGTTGPDARLDVLDAGSPQFRITQADGSVYAEFQVAATTGDLTLNLDPGEDITLAGTGSSTGANLWICKGSDCPSYTLDDDGSLFVESYAYFAGDKIKYPSELGRPKRTIILTASGAITPTTGGAAQTKNAGTNFTYYTLDFDSTADESAYWEFVVPDSFDSSTNCNVYIHWTASAGTAGHGVSWKIATLGRTEDEVLDAPVVSEVEIEDALIAVGDVMISAAGSLNDDWNPGEFAVVKVYRDVDAYSGTNLAADAKLLQVKIEYSVTQESD